MALPPSRDLQPSPQRNTVRKGNSGPWPPLLPKGLLDNSVTSRGLELFFPPGFWQLGGGCIALPCKTYTSTHEHAHTCTHILLFISGQVFWARGVCPVLTVSFALLHTQSCWNCGRKASETCSGCNAARYCGSFCQHKDWEKHHHVCGQSLQGPAAAVADPLPGQPDATASPSEAGSAGPSRPCSPGPPGPLDAAVPR